jgi:hypothetical protein
VHLVDLHLAIASVVALTTVDTDVFRAFVTVDNDTCWSLPDVAELATYQCKPEESLTSIRFHWVLD